MCVLCPERMQKKNDYYGVLWLQIDAVEFDHYIIAALLLHIIVVISRKCSSLIEK